MWIHTTLGYYSITRSPVDPDKFQVRARKRAHLVNLQNFMAGLMGNNSYLGDILETPAADYRWRIIVQWDQLHTIMSEIVGLVGYTNFKSAAQQALPDDVPYHHTLTRTWSAMANLQDVEREQEMLGVTRG